VHKRIWVAIVRYDESVSLRFAEVFDCSGDLRILESQGGSAQNVSKQNAIAIHTRAELSAATQIGSAGDGTSTLRTHVESVLVRLVTMGLGASMPPVFVGDRCCVNFDASVSPPFERCGESSIFS